jgi:hypothetical protein
LNSKLAKVPDNNIAFRLAIILFTTALGALWLYHKGPTPVIQGSHELPIIVPFWYMLSAFPILGMLLADLFALWMKYRFGLRFIELAVQLILLVLLSNLRLSIMIPISGHGLLFSYFILRRLLVRQLPNKLLKIENILGILLLAMVAYMKLVKWNDPMTLLLGEAIGVLLALISYLILRRKKTISVKAIS